MNKKDEIFKKIYFDSFLVSEDTSNKDGKEVTSPDPGVSPIDDLTKENTVTIEDDAPIKDDNNLEITQNAGETSETETPQEKGDEFEDDGWGEEMVENLSPLLNDIEGFIYELRNCVRGSFTGCKTKAELQNYMVENLAARLTEEAENL